MALDKLLLISKIQFAPKYNRDSGAFGVGQSQRTVKPQTDSANKQILDSSVRIGGNKTEGLALFSNKSLDKLEKNKQVIGIGQPAASINITNIGGNYGSSNQPINKVEGFLNQIKNTTNKSFSNSLAQASSSTSAYSVGGGQTRHEQIKADEKVILAKQQDQVVSFVQQRQAKTSGELSDKQTILYNSKSIAKDIGFDQNIKDKTYVELPQLDKPQAIDGKLEQSNAQEIGETIIDKIAGDIVEMTTARIASALVVKRPMVGDKACVVDGRGNLLLPEDGTHAYEFYVEVDSSKDKEVFDYILKYKDKIDAKGWFRFYIGGVSYTQSPSWVSLNYAVPPTRFSNEKVLYFFVKVKSGKAIDTVKNFYFYDTTAKTNTADAKHLILKGIHVYYKKEGTRYYFTQGAYEKKNSNDETLVDRKTTATEQTGTLDIVDSRADIRAGKKSEIASLVDQVNSSEIHESKGEQKLVTLAGLTNQTGAEAVGEQDNSIGIAGDHKGQAQGGKHEFEAHSTAMPNVSSALVGVTGVAIGATGILVGASNIGTIIPASAGFRKSFVPRSRSGAVAVGSSGQDILGVTGDRIESYQSKGFQQQAAIGVSALPGKNNIVGFKRGISSSNNNIVAFTREGKTVLAGYNGSGDENVLLFAKPEEQELFSNSPLAGIGGLTIIALNSGGGLNSSQTFGARSALNAINSGRSSNGSITSPRSSSTGGRISGGNFKPTLGGVGGEPPKGPPGGRRLTVGQFDDDSSGENNNPEDNEEDLDIDNTDEIENGDQLTEQEQLGEQNDELLDGMGQDEQNSLEPFDANKLKQLKNFRRSGEKSPRTGGVVGGRDFEGTKQRLNSQRLNDINKNPVARSRQGQNVFGEKFKQQALDQVKNKVVDEIKKKIVAQAVAFVGGLLTNPITLAVLAAILFGLLIGAVVLTSYCYPRDQLKTMRDTLEPIALTFDAIGGSQSPLETAANVAKLGFNVTPAGLVINAITGNTTLPASNFRKWIESNPACDGPENKCDTNGAAGTTAINGALGTANGKVSAAECTELLKYKPFIEEASRDYGVPVPIIAGLLSRETNVGLLFKGDDKCAGMGDGNNGHGLVQIDGSSGAWGGSSRGPRAINTPTVVKDKDGKPFIWNDCRSNIRYGAFHLLEIEKFYGADALKKGPRGSLEWWKAILNGNNGGGAGVKNESVTAGGNYGTDTMNRAADAAKCLGITSVTTAYPNTRQQDLTNKYWSEAFGFPVFAKWGEKIKNPVLTGLDVLDDRILAFNKVMEGKVSVEASKENPNSSATGGTALGNSSISADKIAQLKKLESENKITYALNPRKASEQAEKGLLNIATADFIIALGSSAEFKQIRFTAINSGNHKGLGHGNGLALDIDFMITSDGKSVRVQDGFNDGYGTATYAAVTKLGNLMDSIGVRKVLIDKVFLKALPTNGKFEHYPDHYHHYHVEINQDGAVSTGSTGSSDGCECANGSTSGVNLQNNVFGKVGKLILSAGHLVDSGTGEDLNNNKRYSLKLGSRSYSLTAEGAANYFTAQALLEYGKSKGFDVDFVAPENDAEVAANNEPAQVVARGIYFTRLKALKKAGSEVIEIHHDDRNAGKSGLIPPQEEVNRTAFDKALIVEFGDYSSALVRKLAASRQGIGILEMDKLASSTEVGQATAKLLESPSLENEKNLVSVAKAKYAEKFYKNFKPAKSSSFNFPNIFGIVKAQAAKRPTSYSDITPEHLAFMAKIAEKRGYFKTNVSSQSELESIGGKQMEKAAATAMKKMQEAAGKDGVTWSIDSGFREKDEQTKLFFASSGVSDPIPDSALFDGTKGNESAYNARLNSSAVPGYSEHATGKVADLRSEGIGLKTQFDTTKAYKWLTANAKTHGFELSYPKNSSSGANYEPWHWRFGAAQGGSTGSATGSTAGQSSDCECPQTEKSSTSGGSYTNSNLINKDADQKYMADAKSQALWPKLSSPVISIIHYTASKASSFDTVSKLFKDAISKGPGNSGDQGWAHYMIDKGGEMAQFIPEDHKVSGSDSQTGAFFKDGQKLVVNEHSIQYEVHYDPTFNNQAITDKQLESLAKTIVKSGLKANQVYTHWAVQPFDRSDSADWLRPDGSVTPELVKFIKYAGWATNDTEANKIGKQILKQNIENAIKVHEDPELSKKRGSNGGEIKLNTLKSGLPKVSSVSSIFDIFSTIKANAQDSKIVSTKLFKAGDKIDKASASVYSIADNDDGAGSFNTGVTASGKNLKVGVATVAVRLSSPVADIGDKLKITNTKNGKSVIAEVTDKGAIPKDTIDLFISTADAIGVDNLVFDKSGKNTALNEGRGKLIAGRAEVSIELMDKSTPVGGSSGAETNSASSKDCPKKSGESGTISTNADAAKLGVKASTIPGTVSKGGPFTPAVRAFLDTLASGESGDPKLLTAYGSGNFSTQGTTDFDPNISKDLHPELKSKGFVPDKNGFCADSSKVKRTCFPCPNDATKTCQSALNIGRYQYYGDHVTVDTKPLTKSPLGYFNSSPAEYSGDVKKANEGLAKAKIDFVIKDFQPISQDFYPIGKYANIAAGLGKETNLSKTLGDGSESGLKAAIEVAKKEWASVPGAGFGQREVPYEQYLTTYKASLAKYQADK